MCTYGLPNYASHKFAATCILLATLTHLVPLAAAKTTIMAVTTAEDFIAALTNKAQDILVGSHLDLTGLGFNGSVTKLHARSIRVCAPLVASVVLNCR